MANFVVNQLNFTMKNPLLKTLYSILFGILLISCGGVQKTTSHLQSGNYIGAFNTAVTQLSKDKTKKSNQKQIPLLKEAYTKAAASDLAEIKSLQKNKTPENLKKVYGNYLNLDIRQDEVKVLQPLYFEGVEVDFAFDDYTKDIISAKKNYSESLYSTAQKLMKGNTIDARNAYKYLNDLQYVNPNYKVGLSDLIQKAKNKGSSFVLVNLKNKIKDISNDSINHINKINASNFDNQWVIYHDKKDRKVSYEYQIDISLDKLTFEPAKTLEETVKQEGKVQDGWQYKKDGNGNVMKDDKGNDIKTAKYKVVAAEVMLYQQNKASKIDGTIVIKDLKKKTTLTTKPEFGEAKFQHTYAKYRGDQRAIDQKYFEALQAKEVIYPKDYEFIKYTISNFKQKVDALLSQQKI